MAWIFCTSGAAIAKAGKNASLSGSMNVAYMNNWSNEAEGTLAMKCRFDISGAWATLDLPIRQCVGDATSDLIAMQIINFDMGGYTSRAEATTMLNVLKDHSDMIIKDLREGKFQKLNR